MNDVTIRDAQPGDEARVQQIVCAALVEYALPTERGSLDLDITDLAAHYQARGGMFRVLVDAAGQVVGCGGLYPIDATTAEIRKMYFEPSVRGRGFGRALLNELIAGARERGFRMVELQTASPLKEAQRLYLRAGFVEVPPKHAVTSCDKGFELTLL